MKKKILLVASLVIILAMLAIGGSLAWFTDNDAVTNVFTIGSVEIDQIEQQRKLDSDGNKLDDQLVDFVNNKVLLPIVNTTTPGADVNYQDKIVTVKSLGDNPAYVSTHIAVPAVLDPILVLDLNVGEADDKWVEATTPTTTVTVGEMEYKVYSFVYSEDLEKNETTQVLLNGVYLKAEVDCQENANRTDAEGNPLPTVKQFCTKNDQGTWDFYEYDVTSVVNVLVATQGCQSQGFSDAHTAIDTAFGAIPNFSVVTP